MVDGPDEDVAIIGACVLEETEAQRAHQDLLEDVKRDAWHSVEDTARGVDVEADEGDGEFWEQFLAEGEIVGLPKAASVDQTPFFALQNTAGTRKAQVVFAHRPASNYYSFMPRSSSRRYRLDSFCNTCHDSVHIVIHLF